LLQQRRHGDRRATHWLLGGLDRTLHCRCRVRQQLHRRFLYDHDFDIGVDLDLLTQRVS
jgi:hypothetical protein